LNSFYLIFKTVKMNIKNKNTILVNQNNKIRNLWSCRLKNGLKKELSNLFQFQASQVLKLKKKLKQTSNKLLLKKRSKLETKNLKNKFKFSKIKQTDFALMQTVNFLGSEEKMKT
jgi:hypothetical protein